MKNINFIIIFSFLSINIFSADLKLNNLYDIDVDFNTSMEFESNKLNILKHLSRSFFERLNLFKLIFNKNKPSKIKISNFLRIPKIIHQIWLGGEFPEKFHKISQVWKDLHADWQYILWTDKNIQKLFPLYNQKFFDESVNLGEKSDILRYEIVYRFGGLYVDIDFECIKPFDTLSYFYDFYAGIEPLDASPLIVGNAFFASSANHAILKYCIETIKDFRHEKEITGRTGPWHLTRSIMRICKKLHQDSVIFLPSSFLYPLKYLDRNNFNKDLIVKKETLGIHYWSGSWK